MKLFFVKSTVLILLVLSTVFGVIFFAPVDEDNYLKATLDKHSILENTPQPRIIFTGDSSLAFGLDSAMVRKSTGYNVVNMGLHGGLGVIYYMDELKPYLKKNDIVVFALDYTHYFSDGTGSNPLIEILIFNPKMFLHYSFKNYRNFLSFLPMTFQRRIRGIFMPDKNISLTDRAFRRSAFNEFGDNIGPDTLPQPEVEKAGFARFLPKMSDDFVDLMNGCYDRYSRKGIVAFLAVVPVLKKDDYDRQRKELNALHNDMKSRLKMPIIGDPLSFIYPQGCFFDNEFHMNTKGRALRTRDLLQAMKKYSILSAQEHLRQKD